MFVCVQDLSGINLLQVYWKLLFGGQNNYLKDKMDNGLLLQTRSIEKLVIKVYKLYFILYRPVLLTL